MAKEQEIEHYNQGLIDGVAGHPIYGNGKQYPEEYLRGHNDGVLFWREMIAKARVRLDCPLTSEVNKAMHEGEKAMQISTSWDISFQGGEYDVAVESFWFHSENPEKHEEVFSVEITDANGNGLHMSLPRDLAYALSREIYAVLEPYSDE